MKIIITESQRRLLLQEIKLDDVTSKIGSVVNAYQKKYEKLLEDVKDVFGKTKTDITNQLTFLVTWGSGIGAFIGPVQEFVNGEFPTLNPKQVTLLLIGVIATFFVEKGNLLKEIKSKIKESNLENEFERTLKKSDELKNTFEIFIKSLGKTSLTMLNMLSYTFLLPLIPEIYDYIVDAKQINVKEFVSRIISFTSFTLAKSVIEKIENVVSRMVIKNKKEKD
jgi:hypothetical protein